MLHWTTERPKVKGYYWLKDSYKSFVASVYELNGTWSYDLDSNLTFWKSTGIEMFAGPLIMPSSTSPEWTKEKPNFEGFYWAKRIRNDLSLQCYIEETCVTHIRKIDGMWPRKLPVKYGASCLKKIDFWAGPIEEPQVYLSLCNY